jgi:uncharacterized membrane protein
MLDGVLFALTLAAALGSGLIAGVFFAFSSFVMKALARIPAAHGIAAMQQINVTVINPWFMAVFVGTALVGLILAVLALVGWHRPGGAWLVAGALLYVVGTFGVTMVFNVPRNDALAAVDPASAGGGAVWAGYVPGWTVWNTVRTVASLAAAAAFILALWLPRGAG